MKTFFMVLMVSITLVGCTRENSSENFDSSDEASSNGGTHILAATSNNVSLAWNASTSPGVNYFVYRGTTSGGPYTKLNSTAQSALTYSDSTVLAGATYYYVTTVVNSSNVESSYSNQMSVSIPAATPTPTPAPSPTPAPTATPAPPAQTITMGDTSVEANLLGTGQNQQYTQLATLSASATLQSLSIDVYYNATYSASLILGVYDSTGTNGGPGKLLAHTASFVPVSGWNTQPVTSSVSLPAGNYWLSVVTNNYTTFYSGNSGSLMENDVATFVMSTPYSNAGSVVSKQLSFYATVVTP
jgi:hypothetical protein